MNIEFHMIFCCCYYRRSEQISIVDDLAFAMYQDPEIAAIIKNLDRKKQEYVNSK
jgi:centrosomal protein CEP104